MWPIPILTDSPNCDTIFDSLYAVFAQRGAMVIFGMCYLPRHIYCLNWVFVCFEWSHVKEWHDLTDTVIIHSNLGGEKLCWSIIEFPGFTFLCLFTTFMMCLSPHSKRLMEESFLPLLDKTFFVEIGQQGHLSQIRWFPPLTQTGGLRYI